jgi:CDP-glycerol glycerophosphotransferase (TagB/SpsB family)
MFLAKIWQIAKHLLVLPFYWFSFIVPRKEDVWIFGAWFGHRYADNSRHLFEYVCAHHPSVRAIWLSHDGDIVGQLHHSGYEAYLINSWTGYWLSCQAALVIVSTGGADINRVGISRAKGIQLFHGVPLKKIMLDDKVTMHRTQSITRRISKQIWKAIFPFTDTQKKWNAIISTSPVVSRRFASAYGVDDSRIKVTGYPRNDVLLSVNPPLVPIIQQLKHIWDAQSIICYVPTHRGEGRNAMDGLFLDLDLSALEDCLERNNAVMLMKMHYYHRDSNTLTDLMRRSSRIHWLSEDEAPDLNTLLPSTDVMITDYSSAYVDYLLLDRPIIFTPFDLEEYIAQDREFYEDYDSVIPGPRCEDWNAVICELDRVLSGHDQHLAARARERAKFHTFVDGSSSERVCTLARMIAGSPHA